MAAYLLSALVARYSFAPGAVQDVVFGCLSPVGAQANNLARHAVLAAGWPEQVPGVTVDRREAGSCQAVHWGAQAVLAGAQDAVVAGGVEVASVVPLGAALSVPHVGKPYSPRLLARYVTAGGLFPPGLAVEEVARRWRLNRRQLDGWALGSHQRAARAQSQQPGHIVAIPLDPRQPDSPSPRRAGASNPATSKRGPRKGTGVTERSHLVADEAVIPHLSAKELSSFAPLFSEDGVVTAANMAGEGDGAAAVLIASREQADALHVAPLARFVSFAVAGTELAEWPTAMIPATRTALARARLSPGDIDHFEVHESSAAAVLAWVRDIGADALRVNPNGGALAYTSAGGAAGAGLFVEAVSALQQSSRRRALVTAAGEGGVATACVLERC
jgi:acetyl-CoA acyltransferase